MAFTDCPQSARPIITLPPEVVNKIAAGEVVVRPLNAVKELIENSLDAGATEITITCKNGGLDLIKVKDNGCGISANNYERVCERFATSKLEVAADLQTVSTFGFRGEALASISCIAKVQVVSRTRDSAHAWVATYKNCKPLSKLTPSAGLVGTQISVEKLFQDYPQRRSVFSRSSEEASGIANLLIKYAINFPSIKFAYVREDGANRLGGSFSSTGNGDQHAIIRLLMPSNLTKNLFDLEISDEKHKFSAKICLANPLSNHTSTAIQARNQKQKIFQLFINNRLVTSSKLKQKVDQAFASCDSYCPFMNISMMIDPARIDVNVHPTKEIVCFLNEAQIFDQIETKLFDVMDDYRQHGVIEMSQVDTLTTIKQTPEPAFRPSVSARPLSTSLATELSPINSSSIKSLALGQQRKHKLKDPFNSTNQFDKYQKLPCDKDKKQSYVPSMASAFAKIFSAPNATVRVDSRSREISEFLTSNNAAHNDSVVSLPPGEISVYEEVPDESMITALPDKTEDSDEKPSYIDLEGGADAGKLALRWLEKVREEASPYLTGLVRDFVFVGFVDVTRAVFQSGNSIYLVEFVPVIEEMFYQKCLRSLGRLNERRWTLNSEQFKDGVPLVSLVDTFISAFPDVKLPNSSRFETKVEAVDELIILAGKPENLQRLREEFGVFAIMDEQLRSPVLRAISAQSSAYIPLMSSQLPQFGFDLICAQWHEPEVATKQIARAIARLNSPHQISSCPEPEAKDQCDMIRRHLFGLLKTNFQVPNRLKPFFVKLLSTYDAYKIFGRC